MTTTLIVFWTLVTVCTLLALMAGFHYGFHRGYIEGVTRANQVQVDAAKVGSDEAIRRGYSEVEMYRQRCAIENAALAERGAKETEEMRIRQENSLSYAERMGQLSRPASTLTN